MVKPEITRHYTPRRMAQLSQALIPKLKSPLLTKHQDIIKTVIIENEIDSLKIGLFTFNHIERFSADRLGVEKLRHPLWKLFQLLKRVMMKKRVPTMKWENIVNAVSHEMCPAIGRALSAIIPKLGQVGAQTADKLINDIVSKMEKRQLSFSEAEYLRMLFERTTMLDYASS